MCARGKPEGSGNVRQGREGVEEPAVIRPAGCSAGRARPVLLEEILNGRWRVVPTVGTRS